MPSDASILEGNFGRSDTRSAAPGTVAPTTAAARALPAAPRITVWDLLSQFKKDVYGKEVQTTSPYSYTWIADQVGHVCLGILFNFGLTLIAFYIGKGTSWALSFFGKDTSWALWFFGKDTSWDAIVGLLAGSILVSLYEFRTYRSAVKEATPLFPLDKECLRDNAAIAAAYMILGCGVGFAFHQTALVGVVLFLLLLLLAILIAPQWLRQKIIWQKAGLPYLFRLADAQPNMSQEAAKQIQTLINQGAPPTPDLPPRQVILGGPIGSGRTTIAAGIGSEFAFNKTKVRYLSFDTLLECASRSSSSHFEDDTGPVNINYWRWCEAQVLIIDDIGPLISAREQQQRADLEKFQKALHHDLAAIKSVLARRHTVWVIGDLCPDGKTATVGDTLGQFAGVVADFCDAKQQPLVVELSEPPPAPETVERGWRLMVRRIWRYFARRYSTGRAVTKLAPLG